MIIRFIVTNKFYIGISLLYLLIFSNKAFTGDDTGFVPNISLYSYNQILDSVYVRFDKWEPRYISILLTTIFTHLNIWVWRIFISLVFTSMTRNIIKIFDFNKKDKYVCVGILMLFPLDIFSTAGWVTTTIYYLLPIAMGSYVLLEWKRFYKKEKTSRFQNILGIIACIMACDNDQMGILIFCTLILFLSYLYKNKINYVCGLCQLSVATLMLFIKHVLSHADGIRTSLEIIQWFPEYGNLCIVDKLYLGFDATFSYICNNMVILFWVFAVAVFGAYMLNEKNKKNWIIAIPLMVAFSNASRIIDIFASNSIGSILYTSSLISSYGMLDLRTQAAFILFLWIIWAIYTGIKESVLSDKYKFILMYVFSIGLLPRILMGLSPTLYASSTRTFAVFYFVLLLIILIYYKILKNVLRRHYLYNFIKNIGVYMVGINIVKNIFMR